MGQQWKTEGLSVIGAAHVKKGQPNQDSVNFGVGAGEESLAFVSVADGHGSKKYLRSELGSHFATQAIGEIIEETAPLRAGMLDLEEAIRHIKSRFLLRWQDKVDDDLEQVPLSEADLETYEELVHRPRTAYGTTFLAVVAYEDLLLILQHGDGDIIGLYDDVAEDLVEPDTRNFAGQTLSLASLFDASEIYHRVMADKLPTVVTLFTDGIKNSYNDTNLEEIEKFYKIPLAIKTSLKKKEDLRAGLQALLNQVTTYGSGDDVTAGVLYHRELMA